MLKTMFKHVNIFTILSIVIGIILLMPLANILFELFTPPTPVWEHIKTYLLFEYISNSIYLVLMTVTLAIMIGLSAAYVIGRYQFKGRKTLSWLLVLPLAIPSYIAGYIYADMTSFTGSLTRLIFNQPLDIMNLFGASLIFAFTLYPYIYLLVLSSLSKQSASYGESAILLGSNKYQVFFKVTLPLLRPALVAGSLLVILETLNDYGLVQYFNVRVFSFAIFNAWFSLGDVVSAIRISAYLMLTVFIIIVIERLLRGRKKFHVHVKSKSMTRKKVSKTQSFIMILFLLLILMIGFFIPVIQMLWYTYLTYQDTIQLSLLLTSLNSIINGVIASILIVLIALLIANFNRLKNRNIVSKSWVKIVNLGYAIPGAVIAIAVHLYFVGLDRALVPIYRLFNPNSPTLLITMSLFTLIFSYVLRFLSIGFNSIESQYEKLGEKYTESAYMLGTSKLQTLFKIDIPLIYPGMITAFILAFIDILKELPLTLILRPANYDSLATLVYVYVQNEMIQEAAVPSLLLIMIAGLFIYLVTHYKKGVFSHVYKDS
ncbi:MAG: iron ABC transporter [Tenericutes bacterium HGW-Tenericutes-6]|jgi:iron(III) transport system permease protein|nr:MAG: iron ABC transporter [Tenericutes bacterium HGW-Tenericutes-6]